MPEAAIRAAEHEHPDVVLLPGDVNSSALDVVVHAFHRASGSSKLIVLGTALDRERVHALGELEVDAYLEWDISDSEAIRQALASVRVGLWVGTRTTMLNQRTPTHGRDGRASAAGLTDREQDVLRCLVAGSSEKEVARELKIALTTVQKAVLRLRAKLDVRNAWQMGARARELGFLP